MKSERKPSFLFRFYKFFASFIGYSILYYFLYVFIYLNILEYFEISITKDEIGNGFLVPILFFPVYAFFYIFKLNLVIKNTKIFFTQIKLENVKNFLKSLVYGVFASIRWFIRWFIIPPIEFFFTLLWFLIKEIVGGVRDILCGGYDIWKKETSNLDKEDWRIGPFFNLLLYYFILFFIIRIIFIFI